MNLFAERENATNGNEPEFESGANIFFYCLNTGFGASINHTHKFVDGKMYKTGHENGQLDENICTHPYQLRKY